MKMPNYVKMSYHDLWMFGMHGTFGVPLERIETRCEGTGLAIGPISHDKTCDYRGLFHTEPAIAIRIYRDKQQQGTILTKSRHPDAMSHVCDHLAEQIAFQTQPPEEKFIDYLRYVRDHGARPAYESALLAARENALPFDRTFDAMLYCAFLAQDLGRSQDESVRAAVEQYLPESAP